MIQVLLSFPMVPVLANFNKSRGLRLAVKPSLALRISPFEFDQGLALSNPSTLDDLETHCRFLSFYGLPYSQNHSPGIIADTSYRIALPTVFGHLLASSLAPPNSSTSFIRAFTMLASLPGLYVEHIQEAGLDIPSDDSSWKVIRSPKLTTTPSSTYPTIWCCVKYHRPYWTRATCSAWPT